MAPTVSPGRDPLKDFAERGLQLVERHETDIALLRQALDDVKTRDVECRAAQGDSWRRNTERLSALEVEMASLKARVAAWAAVGSILGAALMQIIMKLLVP